MISIILSLALFGFVVWLVITLIPMPPKIQQVVIGVATILLLFWLAQQLGFVHSGLLK